MTSKTISNGILRALAIIIGVALFLFLLYQIRSVIAYIVIAAVIALICRPVVDFLEHKIKIRKVIAVVITIFFLLSLLIGLGGLFIPLVIEQGHNLSLLDINKLEANIDQIYTDLVLNFNLQKHEINNSVKDIKLLEKLDFSFIPNVLNSIFSGLGSFSVGVFSIIFICFFFLKDQKLLKNTILIFIPENNTEHFKNSTSKIKNLLSRYFVGLIFQITTLFIIYTVGLLIIGIENAIVIAFLCALLNLIPYLGPFISMLLMLTLTMTSNLGAGFNDVILPKTIWVFVVFLIGQLVDNFLSQPIIFSKSVKSHPLEIFLIILITGILFGVIGLIIAIPAYTAIKVILKEYLSENKIVKKFTKNI